ncbi:MAG: hypothetical protein E7661_02870 [Ruminococcaceae bacterium]|nr:hypothetical protein [Oscillospiraceae bacterium]
MKKTLLFAFMTVCMSICITSCAVFTSRDTETESMILTEPQTYRPIDVGEAYPGEYETLCIGDGGLNTPIGFPNNFILGNPIVRVDAGFESDGLITLYLVCHPECDMSAYKVEVTTDDPEIMRIGAVDKDALLSCQTGGIALKALKPGTAHIYIKLTYTPTGESATMQQIVIVRDPAEATD